LCYIVDSFAMTCSLAWVGVNCSKLLFKTWASHRMYQLQNQEECSASFNFQPYDHYSDDYETSYTDL